MQVPVAVLSSRSYSFKGKEGNPVQIVEAMCLMKSGDQQVVGKVNMRGSVPLAPGNYTASLRVSERDGKLNFSLADFIAARS